MDAPIHRHACEIAFGDTDASGWMHFPNIFRYVEAAEHAFLKARGVLVFERSRGGWPRASVSCHYKRPLVAGAAIEVQLAIAKLGSASISWEFEVINAAGETAATGSMVTVRVDATGRPQEISAAEREQLAVR